MTAVPAKRSSVMGKAHYRPPWADTSIIGIAGSSGSGKTSLALAIIRQLNLPWVIVLSMVLAPLLATESIRIFLMLQFTGLVLQASFS